MGCFRHLDEITGWGAMTDNEKKTVLELAHARKGDYKHLIKFY